MPTLVSPSEDEDFLADVKALSSPPLPPGGTLHIIVS